MHAQCFNYTNYWMCRGPWMSTVVLYCWCHRDSLSFLLFPLTCGAGSTVPPRDSTQVLLCLFPVVLWLWHFLYCVSPHPASSIHIYTFVVADIHGGFGLPSKRRWLLPGTWSHLWFPGVREYRPWCSIVGASVTVHQFFCILHWYSKYFLVIYVFKIVIQYDAKWIKIEELPIRYLSGWIHNSKSNLRVIWPAKMFSC